MASFFDVHAELNKRPDKEPEKPPRADPVTVSHFTAQLKAALKGAFPHTVAVKGEISNFKGPNHSGHLYFSVKDAGAVLPVVMFGSAARNLKFKPADGIEVVVTGRIDIYEQGGKYNFILSSITPVGTGALELAYRQVYAKLESEGLFAPERKRPIPPYPRTIALVTSKGAAGLQDQLKVLRGFPFLRLIVVHVPVQGEGAGERISAALDGVNKHASALGGIDLILLGRGGGSFEDLFEFSREEVARAVGRSKIPVITGIGHEVDTAIADLVADHHAHTPTAAAAFAVQHWALAGEFVASADLRLRREIRSLLNESARRTDRAARHPFLLRPDEITARRHVRVDDRESKLELAQRAVLTRLRNRVDSLEVRLTKHDPRRVLLQRRDTLFRAQSRLTAAAGFRLRRLESRLATLQSRLDRRGPAVAITVATQKLANLHSRLARGTSAVLTLASRRVSSADAQLRVLGPDSILARGFSITRNAATGRVLRSPTDAEVGDTLHTRLAGGELISKVTRPEPTETNGLNPPAETVS